MCLTHHIRLFTLGLRRDVVTSRGRRERTRQELADAFARRSSQQQRQMCRVPHPSPRQCQHLGPIRSHGPASRCIQRPH